MFRRANTALLLSLIGLALFLGFARNLIVQSQTANCKCITDALTEIRTIKVGMKRKNLTEIFEIDGGISPINPERFVYKKCSFIKVEVKFSFVDKKNQFPTPNPEDTILEISKPYIEEPFND